MTILDSSQKEEYNNLLRAEIKNIKNKISEALQQNNYGSYAALVAVFNAINEIRLLK